MRVNQLDEKLSSRWHVTDDQSVLKKQAEGPCEQQESPDHISEELKALKKAEQVILFGGFCPGIDDQPCLVGRHWYSVDVEGKNILCPKAAKIRKIYVNDKQLHCTMLEALTGEGENSGCGCLQVSVNIIGW